MAFERMDGERSLASEPADLVCDWAEMVGRLYVTDRRIVFESRCLRTWRESTEIHFSDIAAVYTRKTFWRPCCVEILMCDGTRHRFAVEDRGRIIAMMQVCKSGALWVAATAIRAPDPPKPSPAPVAPSGHAIQPGSAAAGTACARRL
jgi:hypothetical protein